MFEILIELILVSSKRKTYFKIYGDLINPKQGGKILHRVTVFVKS
jgi:hypothetical protein